MLVRYRELLLIRFVLETILENFVLIHKYFKKDIKSLDVFEIFLKFKIYIGPKDVSRGQLMSA